MEMGVSFPPLINALLPTTLWGRAGLEIFYEILQLSLEVTEGP